ncbi:MAG: Lpp/OprI family alanine-zipper lipoprotein [Gammaproteobacteria bacterium]|jgi:phage shock protein A
MSAKIARLTAVALAAMFIAVGSGCASNSEIDEIRSMAREAKGAADRAERTAKRAESRATEAQRQAEQALTAANAAQACCTANSEKLNRMFKKSMSK